jgi:hypothetical protein
MSIGPMLIPLLIVMLFLALAFLAAAAVALLILVFAQVAVVVYFIRQTNFWLAVPILWVAYVVALSIVAIAYWYWS